MAGEIEALGGRINAYTSYDQTVYYVTMASRYADIGIDILTDAIRNSTFDPGELEREREVILEEIRMGEDDPSRRLFKQTMSTAFEQHPYRRPIIGYERTVKAITRDRMVAFYKKWYRPDRMVFVAVGDFDLPSMVKKVRSLLEGFSSLPASPPVRQTEVRPKGFRSALSYGNFKETYLQIAFPISSVRDDDTPALDVLAQILGGGETSRLVQKVKLEKGLVHSISCSSFTPKDPGLFFIGATLQAENVDKATAAILDEIDRVIREGVTSEELYRVRVNVESDLIYDRQTVQGQARKMGYYEVVTGNVEFEKEYLRRISLLTSEDLRRVTAKYLRPPESVVSILAPSEARDVLKDLSLKAVFEKKAEASRPSSTTAEPRLLKTVLENGIRLIVKENRQVPIVSMQASFLGGVRFE
jgi:zinc protease